jgi:hypothetical protein
MGWLKSALYLYISDSDRVIIKSRSKVDGEKDACDAREHLALGTSLVCWSWSALVECRALIAGVGVIILVACDYV